MSKNIFIECKNVKAYNGKSSVLYNAISTPEIDNKLVQIRKLLNKNDQTIVYDCNEILRSAIMHYFNIQSHNALKKGY